MKEENRKNVIRSGALLAIFTVAILITAATKTATAKSLYVIADIKGSTEESTQPVQAYDIGVDGTLTFQAQHDIPHSMLGAVGMAIDSDSKYVFITYEASGDIQLLEATTMKDAGIVTAPDASDLAGIVYDHDNSLLYCVDRGKHKLYVYRWWPDTATLTHVSGSPFILRNASAYGIALDEIDDLLFVANASNNVTVYSTSTWELVNTITVSRIAISIAVDVTNGLLYTGGGFAGNMFLTQYHLATGKEAEVQVEPDAGVMGLGVDPDTGLIYMSTGTNNAPGGDNLLVYDTALNQIDIINAIGNPTGLAIPGRDIGFNPLNLSKQVLRGGTASPDSDEIKIVRPGETVTYGISFENKNDFKVTDVSIVDILPNDVTFVTASDDGVNGHYEYNEQTNTQTYIWTYKELPPGTSTLLEITVKVNNDVEIGKTITNFVTINTNETPPITTGVDVIAGNNGLNLKKGILGSPEGEIPQVDSNDIITYTIDFDNKDNDFPVTNITVVDTLPKDVTFIVPEDGKGGGKYNPKAHTYTWSFNLLAPGAEKHLELEVSVNPGLPTGTLITNSVTVDCDETPPSSASVDAITHYSYKPLNITAKAIDSSGKEIELLETGERFTYQICFDNNNNDIKVTEVSIIDILPATVSFVEYTTDNDNFSGNYDSKSRTYTGSLKSLEPGVVTCLELLVEVKPDTPSGTVIKNSVTIDSRETPPTTANVNVTAYIAGQAMLEVDDIDISPDILRRIGPSGDIMAVLQLPQGIVKSHIDENDKPELYYQDRNSDRENFILIGEGRQYISGTDSRPKIMAIFDRAELMNAVSGYGEFKLRVIGKLKSGISYYGDAIIQINSFTGD